MGRKLYVGNLPFQTGEDELKLAFAQCGKVVEAKVVLDRDTGRSRGFGFITMSTDAEAAAAAARWGGSDFGGRQLTVNEATDKPRGQSGGPVHQGGYSGASYVADAPPPDRGGPRGGRGGGRSDRGGRRERDYG